MQEPKKQNPVNSEESSGKRGKPVKRAKDPDKFKEAIQQQNRALQKIISKYK